jgi:hypothetical protein
VPDGEGVVWVANPAAGRVLVTVDVVPSSPILVTLMMEALSSF